MGRPRLVDLGLAGGVLAVGEFSILAGYTHEGPRAFNAVVALVVCTALALRRGHALAAALVAIGAWLLQALFASSPSALWEIVPLLVFPYSIAAFEDSPRSWIGGLVWLVVLWAIVLLDPTSDSANDRLFTPLVFTLVPFGAGLAARRFSAQATELQAANVELEERRERDVEAATAEERARIARELHDVVAHSLSVIVVQAGAAEEMLARDPERAAEPLQAIRRSGKSALAEMRRLLGVLREENATLTLAPQPGLGELPALVAQMKAAGLDVELEAPEPLPSLSPGPDLVAYRVVQEALTNTLKHAGKVSVRVALAVSAERLQIEIVDHGQSSSARNGAGHGLIGMRERVALYGGSVDAGPRAGGGWEVRAQLPLEDGS